MYRRFLYVLGTLMLLLTSCGKEHNFTPMKRTPFLFGETDWVDSTLHHMTIDEKIGQLFILKTNSPNSAQQTQLIEQAREGHLGGIDLQGLTVRDYLRVYDFLQLNTKYPLLNIANHTISLSEQLKNIAVYPKDIIGGLSDSLHHVFFEKSIEKINGLDVDLVLETHPNIGLYPQQAIGDVHSLTKNTILATVPFHTESSDSIGTVYQRMVHKGLSGLMVTEDELDKISTDNNSFIFRDWIKEKIQFDGLLLASAKDTTVVQKYLQSGIHLLLVEGKIESYLNTVKNLLDKKVWSEEELNKSVRKVLLAKNWVDRHKERLDLSPRKVVALFDNPTEEKQLHFLYQQTLKIFNLSKKEFPVDRNGVVRVIHTGSDQDREVKKAFSGHNGIQYMFLGNKGKDRIADITKRLARKKTETVILLDNIKLDSVKHKVFIDLVAKEKKRLTIINVANSDNLKLLDSSTVVLDLPIANAITYKLAFQHILGKAKRFTKPKRKLRSKSKSINGSAETVIAGTLVHGNPQEVGINPIKLTGIDALVNRAIKNKVIPGAQIMVIKDGKIIYDKAFGYHTYDKLQAVQKTDLYDIASITKVASTTLAFMKAYEQNKIGLNNTISKFFPVNRSLGRVSMKQLLIHSSRLQANMPIGRYIAEDNNIQSGCNEYFCRNAGGYSMPIADGLYMHPQWKDTLWKSVLSLKPKRRRRTRYSDVNFNLLQKVLEKQLNLPLNDYVESTFYRPLGLRNMTYLPRNRFPVSKIIPTANDTRWRKQLLRGYVHDEGAALLGGVAGSAGVFSNAHDLGVLFQMLLNGGVYGDRRYLKAKTIRVFSRATFGNNRGLGFDSKYRRRPKSCSKLASRTTFGHTGFTGTCVWADPQHNLIFIFLSNRITPDVKNKKLTKTNLRGKIHSLIYKALGTAKKKKTETIMAKQ